jgi:hypothetical protein
MLIDQMKEHPEEFRGYAGKFTNMLDSAHEALQGRHRNVKMSQRDAAAILAAAETHLYEVWLAEDVLTTIMQPKPEVEEPKYKVGSGVLRQGAISNSTLSNNTAASRYDQAYQLELAKLKVELEKQRLQEQDYALRITKPLGGF